MNNTEFVRQAHARIIDGNYNSIRHGSLYYTNGVLYSYGSHYPLLWMAGNLLFVNDQGRSNTTSKHIGLARNHANARVNLGYRSESRAFSPSTTLEATKDALQKEREHFENKLLTLSKRARLQREIATKRIQEINETLERL